MELHNIIVHNLIKDVDSLPELDLAEDGLSIDSITTSFTEQVKDIYYKRSPVYGIFDKNTDNYPFQNLVRSYLEDGLNFIDFTTRSMEILNKNIKDKRATGGYLVFIHFTIPKGEFISVIMLHNTKRFNINNQLEIRELISLDIDKMDIANFVNLTKWKNNEDTYLSFLRGRKEVRQYFTEFIGCSDQTSAKEASLKLKQALYAYFNEKRFSDEEKHDARNKVFEYCQEQFKNNNEIKLESVSAIINADEPQDFMNYACDEEFQVSSLFKGDYRTLKQIRYIKFSSKDLKLEFDHDLLDKTVFFDERNNELKITEVPEKLRTQLLL